MGDITGWWNRKSRVKILTNSAVLCGRFGRLRCSGA